jgi:hypothetical protein
MLNEDSNKHVNVLPIMKIKNKEEVYKTNEEYMDFLDKIKTEFAHFLSLSEKASWTNRGRMGLRARKQSLILRDLLKEFRNKSINNERVIIPIDRERNRI